MTINKSQEQSLLDWIWQILSFHMISSMLAFQELEIDSSNILTQKRKIKNIVYTEA